MLTSSPYASAHPAAPSPKATFHVRPYTLPSSSPQSNFPRQYHRTSTTSAHAPITPPSPKTHAPSTVSSNLQLEQKTADAGTQYSPPGLPPTSEKITRIPYVAVSSSQVQGPGKRRETSRSPSPQPAKEPKEPDPRITPKPTQQDFSNSSFSRATPSGTAFTAAAIHPPLPNKRARQHNSAAKVMPIAYETCDVKDLVALISDMLMELVRFNDEIPLKDGQLTRFHSRAPPGISIRDYLLRLTTHATLSPPILLAMVYYIDRLCALYPAFTISSLTVHRFLIAAATVASKGLSDSFWTNNTYARVGGVSVKELAILELELLRKVDWRIVPKPEVLVDYYRSLVERSEEYTLEVEMQLDVPEIDSQRQPGLVEGVPSG